MKAIIGFILNNLKGINEVLKKILEFLKALKIWKRILIISTGIVVLFIILALCFIPREKVIECIDGEIYDKNVQNAYLIGFELNLVILDKFNNNIYHKNLVDLAVMQLDESGFNNNFTGIKNVDSSNFVDQYFEINQKIMNQAMIKKFKYSFVDYYNLGKYLSAVFFLSKNSEQDGQLDSIEYKAFSNIIKSIDLTGRVRIKSINRNIKNINDLIKYALIYNKDIDSSKVLSELLIIHNYIKDYRPDNFIYSIF
ncbi:MAG: hypothetical protein NT007_13940 [Candidatus Kapabacteria bacterium]|nr:hypothetical protein [Candidatus Kapabacteria bacterium]